MHIHTIYVYICIYAPLTKCTNQPSYIYQPILICTHIYVYLIQPTKAVSTCINKPNYF